MRAVFRRYYYSKETIDKLSAGFGLLSRGSSGLVMTKSPFLISS
ncbi:hypothetical protein MUK42_17991 [Musa troglodytarum]|uniref:Uncharacterized protein n=1 Tax=Musa troglodytarum TaxID=320322 RepID=A0A9E7KTA8_9LILI|nr:hypothetical protein MUK42_17991 [Musa troglodytarum]